jgi:WD40 repeat protein
VLIRDSDFAYDLFISYRRRDALHLAKYLRRRLESFRFPAELLSRLPESLRARITKPLRVYIDVAYEKAAGDFLEKKVIPALDASRQLAVISTPAAFENMTLHSGEQVPNWLCREIDHFIGSRGKTAREDLLVILGPDAPTDHFPGRLNDAERWDWVDLRGFKRGWFTEANDDGLAKLVAALYQIPTELLPQLRQEERRRRLATIRIVAALAVSVAIVTTGLAFYAIREQRHASMNLQTALSNQSRSLSAIADSKVRDGNNTLAALLALRALPGSTESTRRPFVAAAEDALYRALESAREEYELSVAPCTATELAFGGGSRQIVAGCFNGDRAANALLIDTLTGKILATFPGTSPRVQLISISDDGRLVAIGSTDGHVVVWAWDGQKASRLHDFRQCCEFKALRFTSKNTSLMAVAVDVDTKETTATEWGLAARHQVATVHHLGNAATAATIGDGGDRILVAFQEKGVLDIWDTASWKMLQELPQKYARDAKFIGNGSRLLTVGASSATIWKHGDGGYFKIKGLTGHLNSIFAAAVSANGKMVATCSVDGSARVWNAESGELLSIIYLGDARACFVASFSPNSQMLATGDDAVARIWHVPSGRLWMTLSSNAQVIAHLAFAPDGSRLVTSSNDSTISIWSLKPQLQLLVSKEFPEEITDAEFDPDADKVYVVTSQGEVKVIGTNGDESTDKTLQRAGLSAIYKFRGSRRWLQWMEDGELMVVGADEMPIRLSVPKATISNIRVGSRQQIVVASSGQNLLVWRVGGIKSAKMSEARTVQPIVLDAGMGEITGLTISDSDSLLSAASVGHVVVWRLGDLTRQWSRQGHRAVTSELQFSPDGKLLVSAAEDSTIRLWDVNSAKQLCEGKVSSPVVSVAFDADGRRLVVGDEEFQYHLYDVPKCADPQLLTSEDRGALFAQVVGFTKSGRRLLIADDDGSARLWDVETKGLLQTFDSALHRDDDMPNSDENLFTYVRMNRTEDRLIYVSDKRVSIWRILPEGRQLIDYAKRSLPRHLHDDELREFGLGN